MSHSFPLTTAAICATLFGAAWLTSWSPSAQSAPRPAAGRRVAVFVEPGFPSLDVEPISEASLRSALDGLDADFLDAGRLAAALDPSRYDVLVMPYGSAFPEAAWPSILQFLERGGSWVNLGGRPFAAPVSQSGGTWKVHTETTACYKALGFTHVFEVDAKRVAKWSAASPSPAVPASIASGVRADVVYEADIRLTNTKDFDDEDGSDGQREGRLQPLVLGYDGGGTPIAAPVVRVDRTSGRFAGGAWLLANMKGTVTPAAARQLVNAALPGAVEFNVRPTFAGYHPGEVPTVEVTLRQPGASPAAPTPVRAELTLVDPSGRTVGASSATLAGAAGLLTAHVPCPTSASPLSRGLHLVRATAVLGPAGSESAVRLIAENGFWVYDSSMLEGGTPLVVSKDGFTRGGRPFPVLGTTYMASDVHRRFLIEPNPAAWTRDFAAMKAAGVNLVRTGLWTGWKRYMPEVGRMDEAALRALDVFLLTARRYDIPVILNLFAFLPETWGGENPYLDPRSVAAQQTFAGLIAQRYPRTDDLGWDLINEPSFSSPAQLWKTRPNGDRYEAAAWQEWLRRTYGAGGADHSAAALRAWGAAPNEATSLPAPADFGDRHLFGASRPLRAADYRRFSQEMFAAWVRQMTDAIRGNGNRAQLVTVGQDEGGLNERPNPLLFGRAVDFTCMHTWWNNDALVWDGVASRLPDRPMLVEETGLMRYERIGGASWRTEQEAAHLLERKLAMAIGSGSVGWVQWLWNTNVYMASDNEAGIGFFRGDGTARPELAPFVRLSRVLGDHADRLRGRVPEDVVVLLPHAQMFSPRNHGVEATQRAVRVLANHLHVPVRAASDQALAETLGAPRLIVAPSPRVLTDAAWKTLLAAVERGSTLLVTGIIDADERWVRVERSRALGVAAASRPVAGQETALIGGTEFRLGYRGDRLERVETAFVPSEPVPTVHRIARGAGAILWLPVPVELSDSTDATVALYRAALSEAAIHPEVVVEPSDGSVFAGPVLYADSALVALASEGGADREVTVKVGSGPLVRVPLAAGRATILVVDRKSGRVLAGM